jgi:hypothetical protein
VVPAIEERAAPGTACHARACEPPARGALDTVNEDIATVCRRLAECHGGTDLPDRMRATLEIQRHQRLALAQAAVELDRRDARIRRLEHALADDGELPPELRD